MTIFIVPRGEFHLALHFPQLQKEFCLFNFVFPKSECLSFSRSGTFPKSLSAFLSVEVEPKAGKVVTNSLTSYMHEQHFSVYFTSFILPKLVISIFYLLYFSFIQFCHFVFKFFNFWIRNQFNQKKISSKL